MLFSYFGVPINNFHQKTYSGYLLVAAFLFVCGNVKAQGSINDLKECVASKYGASSMLYTGKAYLAKYPKASGHPFLLSNEWKASEIKYNGKVYKNMPLKLNVEDEQLLLYSELASGHPAEIVIDPTKMAYCIINNKKIIYVENEDLGYVEVLYKGKILLVEEIDKYFKASFSELHPYGKYSDSKQSFFIIENNELLEVNSKRDLNSFFPEQKKIIRKHLKSKKLKWKRMTKEQKIELIRLIEKI